MSSRKVEDGSNEPPVVAPGADRDPSGSGAVDVRILVRLLLAAAGADGDEPETDATWLTNETAVDALARRLIDAIRNADGRTRTAEMALRDLVWRVDTARVLIEPKLKEAGSGPLADLLSTDDIHALLRDLG